MAGVAVVKNAALSKAIRRKDQEMNQLILMVKPLSSLSSYTASQTNHLSRLPSLHMPPLYQIRYPEASSQVRDRSRNVAMAANA